jgi:hypothetical protein
VSPSPFARALRGGCTLVCLLCASAALTAACTPSEDETDSDPYTDDAAYPAPSADPYADPSDDPPPADAGANSDPACVAPPCTPPSSTSIEFIAAQGAWLGVEGETPLFPSLLAHLYGPSGDLLCFDVTSSEPTELTLAVRLDGFSDWGSRTALLDGTGATVSLCATPDFDFAALAGVGPTARTTLSLEVTDGLGRSVTAEAIPIDVPTPFMMPWGDISDAFLFVFATPEGAGITTVRDIVDAWSPHGSFGDGGYDVDRVVRATVPEVTGDARWFQTMLKEGEETRFGLDADPGTPIFVRLEAASGEVLLADRVIEPGEILTMRASAEDLHFWVFWTAAGTSATDVGLRLLLSERDVAIYALNAFVSGLAEAGVTVDAIPELRGRRPTRSASRMLLEGRADEVEYALAIVALAEMFAFDACLYISFVNDAVFAGVFDEGGVCWPVDPNEVGTTDGFWYALFATLQRHRCWLGADDVCDAPDSAADPDALILSLSEARAAGILPMPFE